MCVYVPRQTAEIAEVSVKTYVTVPRQTAKIAEVCVRTVKHILLS